MCDRFDSILCPRRAGAVGASLGVHTPNTPPTHTSIGCRAARPTPAMCAWALLSLLALLLLAPPPCHSQPAVCGRACSSDVQCPDTRGVCTYCMGEVGGEGAPCGPGQRGCRCQADGSSRCGGGGGAPAPANSTQPQLLVIGDSISIGWSPVLFPMLPQYGSQHIPSNGGPASKGFGCTAAWLGSVKWDVVLFNFGLHSLDRHRLANGSSTIVTTEAVSEGVRLAWSLHVCGLASLRVCVRVWLRQWRMRTGVAGDVHQRADVDRHPTETACEARDLGRHHPCATHGDRGSGAPQR